MSAVDLQIFRWINGWPEGLRPFFWFMSEATKMGGVRIALAVLAIALIINRPTRVATLAAIIAFPFANWLTDQLKNNASLLRPCVELPDVHLRVGYLDSFGTASAHSANTAAIAAVFTYYRRWWGVIPIAIALFTGLARIYVGVHYPYQVLLGWACGLLAAAVVIYFAELVRRRRTVPDEDQPEPAV